MTDTPVGRTDVPVAIIGMACRLPAADNLEQYWDLLINGRSAVVELPADRLNQDLYYDPRKGQRGKTYSKLGAIISSRRFNRQGCPISAELERGVDNAHLLMCEVAAAACRHAGLDPFYLPLRNTGVYVAHAQGSNLNGDYTFGTSIEEAAQFLREVPQFAELAPRDQEAVLQELIEAVRAECPQRRADSPNLATNMVAGTISRAFRLTGEYMAVNSACASSLQAILFAVRALQLGRIDMAIVGGASDCKSDSLVLFSHAQSMSETGSRPFDSNADGLVCSEGYVSVVLKTLPRALADGDPIQAVIRGLGMSSDGKGKSLWAPRKEGQIKAMQRAYRNGLEIGSLQYIEAHATSTSLGDATELNALAEVLSDKLSPGRKIPVTSVKANIGHALEAAGLASVVKTVLCMQHKMFVPAINIRSLNNKIDWDNGPICIQQQAAPWPEQLTDLPRRAGVNAFGIGGLNVHLLVEEFVNPQTAALATPVVPRPLPSADDEAIAVVGIGCIFPGALTPGDFWKLITEARDPKGPVPPGRWRADLAHRPGVNEPYRTPTTLGGYITDFVYDWRKHKLPPKQLEQADPLQFMLLEAADQALIDAGYDKREFDRTRAAVVVGTDFGSDFGAQLQVGLRLPYLELLLKKSLARRNLDPARAHELTQRFATAVLKHWPALVDESGSFSTSTLASRITKTMNLMGGAVAIDSGDTSAAAALATSVDLLLSGDCDMLFCAAGERRMGLAQYEGMAAVGVLADADHPAGPFDAQARGVVPGEGVGVLLLKRLSDARRDGDRIHSIIRGIGSAFDESRGVALQTAIERALAAARVDRNQVAVVEVDGTGNPQTDLEQLAALQATYGRTQRQQPILLGSITAQIGHTLGASGMASFIKASMEAQNAQMPPIFGLKMPLTALALSAHVARPAAELEVIRSVAPDGRCFAGVLSSDKSLAYHIILERGAPLPVPHAQTTPVAASNTAAVTAPTVSLPSRAPAWRIVRLGAATPDGLAAKFQAALCDPGAEFARAADSRFAPSDRVRMAVVADGTEALTQKLQAAAKNLGNPAAFPVLEQQGCFYRILAGERPRVALLFPGQGSQYPGMLAELVREVPAAAATMRDIDAVMMRKGFGSFADFAWQNPALLGVDVWVTQIAVLCSDLIVHAALTDMGVRADVVGGHSYGEFAALTAAGAWDLDAVITATRARYDAIMAIVGSRGALMASTAPAELIERTASALSERVFAANYNAPDQTVIGGRAEILAELSRLLESHGYKCQILSVPCPFHTPLLAGCGAILKLTLDTLRIRPPQSPFVSTVTNRFVAEPDEIRANLAAQLTTPVRWVDLISRLAREGETVFVEVGPSQALSRLNRRILDERTAPGIISCDNPKRPGVEQLYRVKALLECAGAIDSLAAGAPHVVPTAPSGHVAARLTKGLIEHVDATARRREKKRDTATRSSHTQNTREAVATPWTAHSNGADINGNDQGHNRDRSAAGPTTVANGNVLAPSAPIAQIASAPVESPGAPVVAQPVVVKAGGPAPDQLETFLINFVVEQTGYPPEVVELDADLEADLGIDSIKKAQLFGELAEYFDVQTTEGMTLDEFPTLRHVLNFLQGTPIKGAGVAMAPAPAAIPTPAVAPMPSPSVASATNGSSAAPHVAIAVTQPVVVKAGGPAPDQLETFLINFVVEQTGYPPEVVELDADLEADLGIDSIKKAQLFGELAEYFDVQTTEGMTLDEFPTLRHVLNFLQGTPIKGAGVAMAPAPAAIPTPAVAPMPSPSVASATNGSSAAPHVAIAVTQPVVVKAGGPAPDQLETFLINFVVEQTGYPPEVVELDADLEADLGIDSIKKAQLFGELAEYFDVQTTEGMTLDEFPTLRHVLNFLQGVDLKKNLTPSQFDLSATVSPAVISPNLAAEWASTSLAPSLPAAYFLTAETCAVAVEPLAAEVTSSVSVPRFAGTPYEIGQAHGREHRAAIRRLLRRYADEAGPAFDGLTSGSIALQDLATHFTADEIDELHGIAEGAKVPLLNLLVHNSVLWAELGSASWHFAISCAGNSASRALHSAAEGLPVSGFLRSSLQPFIQVRRPTRGLPHFLLSFMGGVGAAFGANAAGLSVSVCRLDKSSASKPQHSLRAFASVAAMILTEAASVDATIALIKARSLRGAFAACICHAASDQASYLEWDGMTIRVRGHANFVSADNRVQLSDSVGGTDASPVSVDETARMFASSNGSGVSLERLKAQCNGDAAVDSRMAVILDPSEDALWLNSAGLSDDPSRKFTRLRLSELLPQAPTQTVAVTAAINTAPYDLGELEAPVTQRFALKMIDVPLDPADPHSRTFDGAALVVGDNPSAVALVARLRAAGRTVHQLKISDSLDVTLAEFERLWSAQPLPHVFLMTARDLDHAEPTNEAGWRRRWYRVAILPYFLTQRWAQLIGKAGLLNKATLMAGTSFGGQFGFSHTIVGPECGALTGLIKSVVIEFYYLRGQKGLRAVAIDAPDDEPPESFADAIYGELTSQAVDFEVSYSAGRRQLPRAYPQSAPLAELAEIRRGGTWVVTGGARGITALCAQELGRRFGLRLHLIGASPLPNLDPSWRDLAEVQAETLKASVMREAAKNGVNIEAAWSRVKRDIEIDASLRSFAAAGVSVVYHACDVADADAMARVLDEVRQQSGPIEGILHGAGIEISGQFERKKPQAVLATLGTKVDGAVNLMRLTWRDPVRHFIGFGSIAGRLGSNGQTDYGLASDTLCKLAGWYQSRRRSVRSVGFHWHPWAEVGMAAAPATMTVMKRAGGPQQMPKQEGMWHFVRELYVRSGEPEVLITDWDYYVRYYGTSDVPPSVLAQMKLTSGPHLNPQPPTAPSGDEIPAGMPSADWPAAPDRIASRREVELVDAPLPEGTPVMPQLSGTACIFGANATARELRDRMVEAGAQVHVLPMTGSTDEAITAVERLYAADPPRYIFLTTGRDESSVDLLATDGWRQRRAAGFAGPYLATQAIFRLRMKARDTSPITIVAATALGGEFGLTGAFANVDGGALAGLLKSLYIEDTRRPQSELCAKVIDTAVDEPPAAVVAAIFRELAAADPEVEVSWVRGKRRVPRSVERPVERLPRRGLPSGGTWVVTGGARGITAAVALDLGSRYGLKLHLIGSSPAPREDSAWYNLTKLQFAEFKKEIVRRTLAEGRSPEKEWEVIARDKEICESLKKFAAAGVQVTYHSCNLTDRKRLSAVLNDIRRADGPIDGIVHGAGYGDPGRFGTRRVEKFERTLHGKIDGAIHLLAETQSDPVRYFLGFGSISGRHGGNGLSDYAAANDMLAKLCAWNRLRNPACASTCIHWQTWDEVGMAMYGDNSMVGAKGALKMRFISPREGIDHLCRELEAGLPTAEVIVSDGYFERLFYPFAIGQEGTPIKSAVIAQPQPADRFDVSPLPLLSAACPLAEGGVAAEIVFDPNVDPFLIDHQLRGRPLLPAVVSIEAAAEAAAVCGEGRTVVALRGVEMLDGLAFHSARNIIARVRAKPIDPISIACELSADFCNRAGKVLKKDRQYQQATVELADRRIPLDVVMPEPPTTWLPFSYQHDSPMRHGPTLRGVTGTSLEAGGGWGELLHLPLTDFGGTRPGRSWIVPSTLLDAAFYVCGIHAWVFGQPVVSLPKSIERLRLGRMPRDQERCLTRIVCRELQPRHAVYDFTIFGDDRSVILSLEGHRIVMLQQ